VYAIQGYRVADFRRLENTTGFSLRSQQQSGDLASFNPLQVLLLHHGSIRATAPIRLYAHSEQINSKGAPIRTISPALLTQPSRASKTIETLHRTARRAIHSGRFDDAGQCYNLLLMSPATATPRTFMLKALLQQRVGSLKKARKTFQAGWRAWKRKVLAGASFTDKEVREEAQLLQAWGLYESKHGTIDVASFLVQTAVSLDSSLHRVLDWKMFRDYRSAVSR
jgi:hypothetical protein